jgi:hypothetical protein
MECPSKKEDDGGVEEEVRLCFPGSSLNENPTRHALPAREFGRLETE